MRWENVSGDMADRLPLSGPSTAAQPARLISRDTTTKDCRSMEYLLLARASLSHTSEHADRVLPTAARLTILV